MRVYRNIHTKEPEEGSFLIAEVLCEGKTSEGRDVYLVEYGLGTLIPMFKDDAVIVKKKKQPKIRLGSVKNGEEYTHR